MTKKAAYAQSASKRSAAPRRRKGKTSDYPLKWDPRLPKPEPKESPRGLLPTPAFIKDMVSHEVNRILFEKGIKVSSAAKQRMTDTMNMQFFFGGQEVAYRSTEKGVEVLAVGFEEIKSLLKQKKSGEREGIIFAPLSPW